MSKPSSLLEQVRAGLPVSLKQRYFEEEPHRGVHLAVMNEPYLSMLLRGEKTIESRLSRNRVDPFERVQSGDLVLLKAGPVVAAFVVGSAEHIDLTTHPISDVRSTYNKRIRASNDFWQLKRDARFATLLEVDDICRIEPFSVTKRDMRGWVVLRAADRELAMTW